MKSCPKYGYEVVRVKVDGGHIIAGRNPDPSYDGVCVMFETNAGDIIDLVLVESPDETERKVTNVYTYEDVYCEDFTRKYVIKHDDIYRALDGEE